MKQRTFIVAELSANHNHDFDLAVRTIEAISKTGADAVKFQTFRPDSFTIDVDNEYFGPRKTGLWKGYRAIELNECPHVTKLAKFKLPSCPKTMFWNTLCRI